MRPARMSSESKCLPIFICTRIFPTAPTRRKSWPAHGKRVGLSRDGVDRSRHRGRLRTHGGCLRFTGNRIRSGNGIDRRSGRQRIASARLFSRYEESKSSSPKPQNFKPCGRTGFAKWLRGSTNTNIPLRAETVFEIANCRSPGRPHVGRALVREKFCSSMDEAFERFLKKGKPAWVPKFKISAFDAIELIHGAGGLAVMAHPGLNRTDSIIPGLVEAGMDGIECFHSKHPPKTSEHYLQIAAKHHLLVTGGSDCHGMSKGKPLIGTREIGRKNISSR